MTWYGLSAEVVIEGDYWHWVRLGCLPIPHPPVINLLLRRGMPNIAKRLLSYWHEVGHLQTLPWAILLAGVYLGTLWWRMDTWGGVFSRGVAALIGHEAIWELGAEGYLIMKMGKPYWQLYGTRGIMTRIVPFYLGMTMLAVMATWYVGWG